MPREYQIRVESKQDDLIDCLVYHNLADANIAYNAMLAEDTEGETYQLELIEVLRQDSVCCGVKVDRDWLYAPEGGGHVV